MVQQAATFEQSMNMTAADICPQLLSYITPSVQHAPRAWYRSRARPSAGADRTPPAGVHEPQILVAGARRAEYNLRQHE